MKIHLGTLRRLIREELKISTFVDDSNLNGAGDGLFSGEDVEVGQLVSDWNDEVDRVYQEDEIEYMHLTNRKEFEDYASWDGDRWYLSGDDAKYMNHSSNPNVRVVRGTKPDAKRDRIASRDIEKGEELTINYDEIGLDGI